VPPSIYTELHRVWCGQAMKVLHNDSHRYFINSVMYRWRHLVNAYGVMAGCG